MIKYTKMFALYQSLYPKNCLSSHSCHFVKKKIFFGTKFLHAYVKYVYNVKAKYQIVLSKALVGVDWPMKILSMHIQKTY